ncbi:MAG: D-cysteine desulfhydrase [Acidimicrobiales bacterium]|nr:D-cysteine desulfhydrase [Acidimicrobiales bacterium]
MRALFDRLPRLADMVPFVELADGLPTRVEQLGERLWVKRDDATSSRYGGNKVRKFEFVMPVAARRGGPMLTAGGIGSHHVLAAAIHGRRLGLDVEAVLYPQPETDDVRETQAELALLGGVRVTRTPHAYAMPVVLAARMAALAPRRPYLLWPGASTPLGTLGYVSAGLELTAQLPAEPDVVVVPLGSGGTAVGIALGLALAGWRDATVVAVRAADAVVTNAVVLRSLEAATAAILAIGGWRPRPARLVIERSWLGRGYGHPTTAGAAALESAADLGLTLEPTYTAKAFAAALDLADRGQSVAFVLTFAGGRPGGSA